MDETTVQGSPPRARAIPALAQDPDLELLERWRAGESAAGQTLFKRHLTSLHRFFQRKCDGDIDELVQLTLLGALPAKERFRGEASFRTYLFAIARNTLARYLRDKKPDARFDLAVTPAAELIGELRSVTVHDLAYRALLDALRALPVEQQMLLELFYWEEVDTIELAKTFEVPAATIRTWLFRARGRLREILAANTSESLNGRDDIVRKARPPSGPPRS